MQGEGERATGTPNTIYDLSSVLFHALEGGATYDQFIQDAEREGDQELVEFFRLVRDEDSNRGDRAQQLLAERTSPAGRTGGTTGAMAGTEPSDVPPVEAPPREDALGREDPLEREKRGSLGREDPLGREERTSLGREDRLDREERGSLGREDPLGREERGSLGREDPLGREKRGPLGREDPPRREEAPAREEERTGQTEGEEDKGLIDKALDKLSGREDEERRER